jgi:hypothetical protein
VRGSPSLARRSPPARSRFCARSQGCETPPALVDLRARGEEIPEECSPPLALEREHNNPHMCLQMQETAPTGPLPREASRRRQAAITFSVIPPAPLPSRDVMTIGTNLRTSHLDFILLLLTDNLTVWEVQLWPRA